MCNQTEIKPLMSSAGIESETRGSGRRVGVELRECGRRIECLKCVGKSCRCPWNCKYGARGIEECQPSDLIYALTGIWKRSPDRCFRGSVGILAAIELFASPPVDYSHLSPETTSTALAWVRFSR